MSAARAVSGAGRRLGGAVLLLAGAIASTQCRAPAAAPPPPPQESAFVPLTRADGRPLSPLALAGRDLFLREGCHVCHAVVPPGVGTVTRWPDEELVAVPGPQRAFGLESAGGKYTDAWHYLHLESPTAVSPGSIMPAYPFLLGQRVAPGAPDRVAALLARLGAAARADTAGLAARLREEGAAIAQRIGQAGPKAAPDSEVVALIAYLQQLDHPGPEPPASGHELER